MTLEDVDAIAHGARGLATAGTERIVTHLAFDAARDAAAAAAAHSLRAQFVEHEVSRVLLARRVLRGEWPPRRAACGG